MLEPCLWLGVAHSGDLVAAALAQLLWSHVWLGHVSVCWVSWKLNLSPSISMAGRMWEMQCYGHPQSFVPGKGHFHTAEVRL